MEDKQEGYGNKTFWVLRGKSVHNVPDLTLLKQAGNLRNSIKLIGNNK